MAWEEPQDGDGKDSSVTPAAQGTKGRSPGWRLDGAYVLKGMVPVGRSQYGAARAMGSQKALLKLVETKGIGSQRFPHPKIELSEHPELFGSALEL